MKDYVQIICVFAVLLFLIPLIGLSKHAEQTADSEIKILDEDSGKVISLSLHDYIVGSVFAQMPADFSDEALKAQAVLASTYASRRTMTEKAHPTKALKGAVLSTDTTKYQAYFSDKQARALYGKRFDKFKAKISKAADYAENRVLTYNGEPILVAFHGISFGKTESALSMWNEDVPYLQSVDSGSDKKLSECENEVFFGKTELKAKLSGAFKKEKFEGEPNDWLGISEKTEAGTILKVKVGENIYGADRLCRTLGLASQHFEIEFENGGIRFITSGCGHLVGMSQYGAQAMAENGKKCEEILSHYFKDTVLIKTDKK